jgi:hypothetical protein
MYSSQRIMAKPPNQEAAQLPQERVSKSPPFTVTGVDNAGHVYCCDYPAKKFYISLVTCGVVRAVHLELASAVICHPENLF